jgi:hypothetical protein
MMNASKRAPSFGDPLVPSFPQKPERRFPLHRETPRCERGFGNICCHRKISFLRHLIEKALGHLLMTGVLRAGISRGA